MQEQNFKNHIRKAPITYYSGILAGLIIFIWGIIKFLIDMWCDKGCNSTNIMFVLSGFSLLLIGYYARMFALKAQDRAIRAEENLRYFSLTGKLMSSNLKMSQVIALRFASDDEFVALAERAEKEQLSNKQIKESVKSWRPDFYRV